MNDEVSGSTTGHCVLKHAKSAATDSIIDYEIEWTEKIVTLTAATSLGRPFLPASQLKSFILGLLAKDYGIAAWDDDEAHRRTDWTVLVLVESMRFRVRLIKQLDFGVRSERWALELFPIDSELES